MGSVFAILIYLAAILPCRFGESITQGGGTTSSAYTYDNAGNRTVRASTIAGVPPVTASYTARDLLTTDTYDNNGNTTVSGSAGDSYDFENHLVNRNNGAVQIVYDGDGNRVRKMTSTGTTYYVVDDRNPTGYAQVLEELSAPGSAPTVTYTYGHSLISQNRGGVSKFYGYDGHNNVRMLTDAAGNWTDAYTYDAFGILIGQSGSTANNYLYCGEQFDPDLAMYYLRARYMNAGTGRFWTMDTFEGHPEDPLSLHKYLYCYASPVNNTDPTGQDPDAPSLMATITTWAYMAANVGLRAGPALARTSILVTEITTGQTIILGGGAISGYAAMSRVEGGIGSWTAATAGLKGIVFGPYGYVRSILKGSGVQAHHLNQSGAYPAMIKEAAACVELDKNAFIRGTEHNQFHVVLERFWEAFRKSDKKASNQEYLMALRDALGSVRDAVTGAAKFTKQQVDLMVEFAEKEQRGYGYHDGPGGLKPEIPKGMYGK